MRPVPRACTVTASAFAEAIETVNEIFEPAAVRFAFESGQGLASQAQHLPEQPAQRWRELVGGSQPGGRRESR